MRERLHPNAPSSSPELCSASLFDFPNRENRRTNPLPVIGQTINPAKSYKYDTPEVINTHSYYVVQNLKLCSIYSRDT